MKACGPKLCHVCPELSHCGEKLDDALWHLEQELHTLDGAGWCPIRVTLGGASKEVLTVRANSRREAFDRLAKLADKHDPGLPGYPTWLLWDEEVDEDDGASD